ncbi:MAG: RNB domain-containing ribonuclease, partial [Bacteroidales bacterium]|nr:RNB domain-containing ribonuclease [Bacteroidales bacterium]
QRFQSGSISFERPEMKVIVDANGKPVDVVQKISREANWLIEEFMLLANREVATCVTKGLRLKEPTFVYRVHDEPDYDKVRNLKDFVKHFGYQMGSVNNGREVAAELNALLEKAKGKPECGAIEIIALRSMSRAKYSTDNVGHYGLGFDYYTHFTSPIRRYPDMMVHRLLTHYLDKGKNEEKNRWEELCKHSSNREHLATEAERSSIKYKLAEYMQDKVGQEFEGSVSGITEWGMYVEIEPTKVEGMVMLREIKEDFFIYDEKNYCLIGKSTRKRFTLGDKVRIKVSKTNLEQKLIDYTLVWDTEWNRSSSRKGSARKRK